MNSTYPNIRSIFSEALEHSSPQERRTYLEEACRDEGLRARVQALLDAHDRADDFLELAAPAGDFETLSDIAERPGTIIGHYKLLEEIGEGGFGVVFMAEQQQPVRRKVALKVLKPGMDSRQVIARFEAERQALALMDHPNIAHVFDAGATESGRPYFVMELVRGIPITEYCDQHELSLRERLELFVSVCQAVQHAHQKEVIHRDIKPSNVLVTLHDGKPVAKVIDFGVAKATGRQTLTDRTMFTGFNQFIGTPLYMSPEQAELSGLDIDTRSDIYSLGVLLYELLTGTTPFDRTRFGKTALDEIRRIIREEDPQKPSTRLSQMRSAATGVGSSKTTPHSTLRIPHVKDLDWIVMKALEKERERRYESASSFALDIQRFLADEPVVARPPSTTYRMRKFARRNRMLFSAVSVVAFALVAGTIASALLAIKATHAQQLAHRRLEAEREARAEADVARSDADAARQDALANLQKARDAVDRMLTRVAEDDLLQFSELKQIRRRLLEDALEFNQGLLNVKSDNPELRLGTAKAHVRLGSIQRTLGRSDNAALEFRQGAALLESLSQEFPDNQLYRRELVHAYLQLQLIDDRTRSVAEEEQSLRRAVTLADQLVSEDPNNIGNRTLQTESYCKLGRLLSHSSRLEEAEPILLKVLDYARGLHDPDIEASAYNELGFLYSKLQRLPEAESNYRQVIAAAQAWLLRDLRNPLARRTLGFGQKNLAYVLACQKRLDESAGVYEEALATFVRLSRDFPDNVVYSGRISLTAASYGDVLKSSGRIEEAIAAYRKALEEDGRRVARMPAKEALHLELNRHAEALDRLLAEQSQNSERRLLSQQVVAIYDSLLANDPDNPILGQVRDHAQNGFPANSKWDEKQAIETDEDRHVGDPMDKS